MLKHLCLCGNPLVVLFNHVNVRLTCFPSAACTHNVSSVDPLPDIRQWVSVNSLPTRAGTRLMAAYSLFLELASCAPAMVAAAPSVAVTTLHTAVAIAKIDAIKFSLINYAASLQAPYLTIAGKTSCFLLSRQFFYFLVIPSWLVNISRKSM